VEILILPGLLPVDSCITIFQLSMPTKTYRIYKEDI
jgi:hypothetical protein